MDSFKHHSKLHNNNHIEYSRLPAGMRRRRYAFLIDFIIILIIYKILLYILGIIIWYIRAGGSFLYELNDFIPSSIAIRLVLIVLAGVGYFTLTTYYWNGQTIGKNILKIRVIRNEGGRMRLWVSFKRIFGYPFELFSILYNLFKKGKGETRNSVQDNLAETSVIYEPHPPPEPPKEKKKRKRRKRLL